MKLLHTGSLAETLDAVNDALFFERKIPKAEALRVSKWLAARQGQPGSYPGLFAPTQSDYEGGIRLFTGERITTRAATGHVLGEETCRVLRLLDSDQKQVKSALGAATKFMDRQLGDYESETGIPGFY